VSRFAIVFVTLFFVSFSATARPSFCNRGVACAV
jgi:hypothetical protein